MHPIRDFWRHATIAPFAAGIAMYSIIVGARVVFDPMASPVYAVMPLFISYVYAGMALVGGGLILFGAGARKARYEAAGCALFAGMSFTQGISVFLIGGQFVNVWGAVILLNFTIAGAIRARRLIRGDHLVWVTAFPPPREPHSDDRKTV